MIKIKYLSIFLNLMLFSSCFFSQQNNDLLEKLKKTKVPYWFDIKNEKNQSIGCITNFYKQEMESIFDAGFCNLSIINIISEENNILFILEFSIQTPDMKEPKIEYYKCSINEKIVNDIIFKKIDTNAPRNTNCQHYTIKAIKVSL